MPSLKDLTGQKFGRLKVIIRAQNNKCGKVRWLCKCDCGGEVKVCGGDLRSGRTKSCGCLNQEMRSRRLLDDLTGRRFGRLNVIKRGENSADGKVQWICICDCGNQATVRAKCLRFGETSSCGCLHKEWMSLQFSTHGMSSTRLFWIWNGMKQRCINPNASSYEYYGGRGIKVCQEWLNSVESFRDWALANGYEDHLTIDRKDNDGNYEPGNCRWATRKEQANNTSLNHQIHFRKRTQTLAQWCGELGLKYSIVYERLFRYGWTVEQAFTTSSARTSVGD